MEMPELPTQRRIRYVTDFGLSERDASALTANAEIGGYFEHVTMNSLRDGESLASADSKTCANWVINDIAAKMNQEENLPPWAFRVSADTVGHIIRRMREGLINAKTGKSLLSAFWEEGRIESEKRGEHIHGGYPQRVDELISEGGLGQISDDAALAEICDQVIGANPQQVADYRNGKEKALNSLVGQAMKLTRGKANPQQVTEILKRKLS